MPRKEKEKKHTHKHHHKHHHHKHDGDESAGEDIKSVETVDAVSDAPEQMPFFGLLSSEQSQYFKQAEQNLNLDTFENPEQRAAFIQGVFDEAKGQELKLATNQICSKLMERLVLGATESQLRQMYNGTKGHLYEESIHKYASHVLETFLVRVASMVEKELSRRQDEDYADYEDEDQDDEATMESIVLELVKEIGPKLKELAKSKYGSHVLRLLLLVLAGKTLPSSIESNSILRSKKSKIARKMVELEDNEDYKRAFEVPSTFKDALKEIIDKMFEGQTTESLREMAIDPVASPVLQLLIELEGIVDRDRPFWNKTFAPANEPKNDKEGAFVEYLLSDPVGSHFLETALSNQKMKNINRIYKSYMQDRVTKLAKRETTGAFVVQSLLEKLRSQDQKEVLDQLVPILNELIVNNFGLGESLIDASERNDGYLRDELVAKLFEFFNRGTGDKSALLENVLHLTESTLFSKKDDWPTSEERRRALFLEKLVGYDKRFLKAATQALLALEDATLLKLCMHGVFSHVVEHCISDPEKLDAPTRRRLLNKLVPHVVDLAANAQGSHIADKLWPLSYKLNNYKERVAKELKENEELVKRTVYGRQVWKNWDMESYSRRFGDWKWKIKQEEIDKAEAAKKAAAESQASESSTDAASGSNRRNGPWDARKRRRVN